MKNDLFIPALVLGGAIVLAAFVGTVGFYKVRALDNTLTVTGSATATTTADAATWYISLTRTAQNESSISGAHNRIGADVKAVLAFLEKAGIPESGIQVAPESINQDYSSYSNSPKRYNVTQQVTVTSNDVRLVDKLSKDISALVDQGINVSSMSPQYFVTTLPKIRVALIGKAVSDARARAVEIAKSTGQGVGALKSASSGVVQVLSPNSMDVSDYGSYDTSTIDKQVMVTARAVFLVQ